jgi:death on curing protein
MTAAEPVWIEEPDVLAIHERLLVFHGGAEGLRDQGLLASALARAKHIAAYDSKADLIDMASAYTAGIIQNHPFVDGNKRTGFVIGILFLELNGYHFTASEPAAALAVETLAAGTLTEAQYTIFLRANVARG